MSRPDPTPDPLRRALREMPRLSASAGFTRRVVEARHAAPRRAAPSRLGLAMAAAAAIALVVAVAPAWLEDRSDRRERRAVAASHAALAAELAALDRRMRRAPTLYVDSQRDYDVVVDLSSWLREPSVQPVLTSRDRH